MIKRTLYFGNPAYLSISLDQLVIRKPNMEGKKTIPIEDIGIVLLDHQQITITHEVLRRLQENKAAIISCDKQHMPTGLMLPLEGNYIQSKIQKHQLAASEPLKKQLWQQTVIAKVRNQKLLLEKLNLPAKRLHVLESRVQSGDPTNVEGQAAAYYWKTLFKDFKRDRYGEPPNHLLNYGYIVLRAMVARALVSSGLLPTFGIFHKNQYNAFALADDIMEPYRPFIDNIAFNLFNNGMNDNFLNLEAKRSLLSIATVDAIFGKKKSPLMVGLSFTSRSLAACFEGTKRKIQYPIILQ